MGAGDSTGIEASWTGSGCPEGDRGDMDSPDWSKRTIASSVSASPGLSAPFSMLDVLAVEKIISIVLSLDTEAEPSVSSAV